MSISRHLTAVVLLPGTVTLLIPALIVWAGDSINLGWWSILGGVIISLGLAFFVYTLVFLTRVGRGTLAPWDPTQRLVAAGPYGYVRNPMITAVLAIVLGEAVLLGSPWIASWFGVFFAMNAVYFPLSEEPGLQRRFGAEYAEYRANVPRWIPRFSRWRPSAPADEFPPSGRFNVGDGGGASSAERR